MAAKRFAPTKPFMKHLKSSRKPNRQLRLEAARACEVLAPRVAQLQRAQEVQRLGRCLVRLVRGPKTLAHLPEPHAYVTSL